MDKLKKIFSFLWPIFLQAILISLDKELARKRGLAPVVPAYPRMRPMPASYVPSTPRTSDTFMGTGKFSPENPAYPRRVPVVGDQYENLTITTDKQDEVDAVLERLKTLALRYEGATVADFYDLISMSNIVTHTDAQWGWKAKDLESISPTLELEGWTLKLPRPRQI